MELTKTVHYDVTVKATMRNEALTVQLSLTRDYGTPPRSVTVTEELVDAELQELQNTLHDLVQDRLPRLAERADLAAQEAMTVAINRQEVI